MKKRIILSIALLLALIGSNKAQDVSVSEKFGHTLNIAAGIGYYGYVGHPIPAFIVNYEFDIAKNFTLAPFIGVYTYREYYYWGSAFRDYSYRETAIPIGAKGAYYFDQLLHATPKWDFYAAASLGFVIRTVSWESGYTGDIHAYRNSSPLYLNIHAGAEYHFNDKAGIFLDLSSGLTTFGLAIHM